MTPETTYAGAAAASLDGCSGMPARGFAGHDTDKIAESGDFDLYEDPEADCGQV